MTAVSPPPGEVARFWSHVVAGPGERDCWLWVGAIADDGYGPVFWITRAGHVMVVRPHRYAVAVVTGGGLDEHQVVEHLRCDNPICVRVQGTQRDHVVGSTQAANIARISTRGRRPLNSRAGTNRTAVAERSRALRAAVRDGWNTDQIASAVTSHPPEQAMLW